jgi:hypothetical protein
MWYHPAAFFLTKRDVIGAWLICIAVATAFFGYPAVTAALDIWAGNRDTTTASPEPVNWSAQTIRWLGPAECRQAPRGLIVCSGPCNRPSEMGA